MNVSAQGDTRRLDCQVIGWPVPDIVWLKDEVDITRDPRYRYSFDGEAGLVSLFIDNIQPNDSGWYTCVALNDHGSVVVRSLLVVRGPDGAVGTFADRSALDDARVIEIAKQSRRLSARSSVTATGDSATAPRFIAVSPAPLRGPSVTCFLGDRFVAECEVAGQPSPSISWLKNGQKLSSSDHGGYRFESESTRHRLVIDSLSVQDGGAYSVRLENSAGVAEHEFKLDVKRREKPDFSDSSSSNTFEVTEGDHVLITFQLTGQPAPQVNWIKDGRGLTASGQRVKLEANEQKQQVSFELAYAERTDAGHYECVAENSEGRTQRKFELIVKGLGGWHLLQFLDKEFKLLSDAQLMDARTGEILTQSFAKGTHFIIKDGQSARNWLIAELSPEKDSSQLLFCSPASLIPVEKLSRQTGSRRPSSTEQFRSELLNFANKGIETSAKKRSLLSEFTETEKEFIDELSKLAIDTDRLMEIHRNIIRNIEEASPGTKQLDELLDELLGDLFKSILDKLPSSETNLADESLLSDLRSQNMSLTSEQKQLVLPMIICQMEYYIRCLQELSNLNVERATEILGVVSRIITFEKTIVDRPFIENLHKANQDYQDLGSSCIRHDMAVVKGPQGWRSEADSQVALFDGSILIINNNFEIKRSIQLSDYRITEISEKSLFINLQHQTGWRWTLSFPALNSYLCFLKELGDSGCLRQLLSAQSALSIWSSHSSDELVASCITSGDEYLSAREEMSDAEVEAAAAAPSDDEEATLAPPPDERRRASITPEPSFKPSFTCDPKELNLVEGQSNQVALSFVGQPKPTIQWLTADRKPLAVDGFTTVEEGNLAVLKIADARLSMTGRYICQLTNSSGTAELYVDVGVKPNVELHRPRFIKQLSDTSVTEDGSLSLTTEFSSTESVTSVEWLLNGQTVKTSTSKSIKITTTERSSNLSIEKVEKSFSGAVSCVVSNQYGQSTSTCGVSVRAAAPKPEPPKAKEPISITSKISKAQICEGEDFVWTCAVKAPEPFRVTWSKVGEVCDQEALSRISLETVGSDSVLFHIKKVHVTDGGTYRCTLTYEEEVTYCEVFLGVSPSDEIPEILEGPTIDKATPNSVTMSWPKVVVTNKTITYTIEQTITETGEWSIVKSHVVETTCEVKDLLPSLEYWFRVFAEDEEGRRGKPSPAVGFVTGEEVTVPNKPQAVKLDQLGANHWIFSWEPPTESSGAEELTYLVEVFDVKTQQWRKLASGVQKTKIEMKQLKADQQMRFRVRSVNSAGMSEPSDEAVQPVEQPTEEIPAPAKLMLVELSPTLVWLIWQPPPNTDGLVYVIEAQDSSTGEWCRLGEHGVTETRIELNNLLEGEEYKFRVRSLQESTQRLSSPSNEVCRPAKWSGDAIPEAEEQQIVDEEIRDIATGVIEQEFVETVKKERVEIVETDESVKTVTEELVTETKQIIQQDVAILQPVPEEPKLPATPTDVKITYKPDNVACLEWKSGEADGKIPDDVTFLVETKLKADQWSTIVQNIKATNIDLKGLKMERDYFFRVRAKGDNGMSEPSAPINCKLVSQKAPQPPPPPAPEPQPPKVTPQQPSLTVVDKKSVKVQWASPETSVDEEVTGYQVEVLDKSKPNATWQQAGQVSGKAVTSYQVDQLDEAHEYEFRVAAVNAAGSGIPTQPILRKAQVGPQNAPEHLKLDKVDGKKYRLSWDAVAEAQTYTVEVRDKSDKKGEWKRVAGEVAEHFASIESLEATHEYEIRVVPANEYGLGKASQPIIRQAALPPQKPPTDLKLEEINPKSVKLSWKSVDDATTYRVEMIDKSAKKAEWKKVAEEVADLFTVVQDLEPSKEYELRVAAVSESGVGVPSQPVVRHAKKPPQTAPTAITIENVDPQTARVKWAALKDDSNVAGYAVERKSSLDKDWQQVGTLDGAGADSFEVADLKGDLAYEFRVVPTNEIGRGAASKPVQRQAQSTPQQAPPEVKVTDLADGTKAKVEWKKVPEASKGYVIEILEPGQTEWKERAKASETATSVDIKDLNAFKEYSIRVAGVNELGTGVTSEPVKRAAREKSPLKTVEGVQVTEDKGTSCKLLWKTQSAHGRSAVKYRIEMMGIGVDNDKWSVLKDEVDGGSFEVKDLKAEIDYSFRITAIDPDTKETGLPSDEVVKPKVQIVLTAPQSLKIGQLSESSALLTWQPLAEIKDLRYQIEQNVSGKWQILSDKHTENTFELKDLKPDTKYLYLVRAKAAYGAGPPSNDAAFPVIPPKPEGLTFAQAGDGKALLTWKHERLSSETFSIEMSTGSSGNFREALKDVADLKAEISGLKPDTDYVFKVRAKNPFTEAFGDYSAEVSGKLVGMAPGDSAKVGNVKVKEADSDSNKVQVSWTKLPADIAKCLTGYEVQAAPGGTQNWFKSTTVSNPEASQADVYEGVDRAKDMAFRVLPVNKYGYGPASDAVTLAKRAPQPPKLAPSDIQVYEGKDDKTAMVSWKTLPALMGCCYAVERKACGGSDDNWQSVADNVADSKVEVGELVPEATYVFRVFAKNDAGRGPPSPEITLASRVKPPSQIPVGLTVKPVSATKALLEWTFPDAASPLSCRIESRLLPSGTYKPLAEGIEATSYEAGALKPDCEYAFRARLQNSIGQMGMPSADVLLGKRSAPEPLRGAPVLKELPTAAGSYELSWSEVPTPPGIDPTRYVIECASSATPPISQWAPLKTPSPITKSPFILTDLQPEHEYRYRISTENNFGLSEPSLEAIRKRLINPVAPARMTSRPLIDNDTGTSCRISWMPLTTVGLEEPFWYQVERAGEDSKVWTPIGRDLRTNDFLVNDLKPEDYWRFRVRACNRFGEGEPSIEVYRDRLVDPVPPKKPRMAPTLADIDDYSCHLSWTNLGASNDDTVLYIIERLCGPEQWTTCAEDVRETSYLAKDLNPEDEYWFRIRGKNRFGLGDPSPHAVRYRKYDAKAPKTITGVPSLTEISETAARLNWTPIRGPGPETLYIIEVSDSSTPNSWRTLPNEIAECSYDVNDLSPSLDYRFRIRSKNKFGTSEASREAYRPKRYDPSAFKVPGQPQIMDIDDTTCKLSWRPLEIPDVLYRVESLDETQQDWSTLADRLTEPPHTISNLKPDLDYRFRIRGFSDRYGILGDASAEVMRYGPYSTASKRPPRPLVSAPILTEIDDTTYRLSWTACREPNTKYIIEAFDSDRCEWYRIIDDLPDPWYELSGLKTDCDYRFRVRASNRYGNSEASLEALRPKRAGDKCPPGPIPGIPTLLDLTDTSCRLMWLPVYGNKSSLMYIIESLENDTWIEYARDITLTSYDLKDLDSEREYFFRIRAKNQYGFSEPSPSIRRSSNVVKAKEVPPRPVTSLPSILEISDSHIQLSWEASRLPGNAKQTRIFYVVEGYDSDSSGWKVLVDDLEDLLVEFDNLDSQKEYTFRVRAKNEYGSSEPSVPATRYRKRPALAGPPGAPNSAPLIEDLSETSIRLSWIAPLYAVKSPGDFMYVIETRDEITYRWTMLTEQSELSLDINDLSRETDYWFRLRVKDIHSGLLSGPGPDSCKKKKPQKKPPLVLPNRPRITEIDDHTIRLNWSSTSVRGADKVTYIVEMFEVGSPTAEWKQIASHLDDTSRVIKELDAQKSYSFRIKVETEYGISEPSTEVVLKQRKFGSDKFDIGLPPGSVSGKPFVQEMPDRHIKLSWRPARSRQRQRYNDEEVVLVYTVQMCIMGSDKWETLARDLTTTEYSLFDLPPRNNYQFRVIASNRYGASDPSPIASLIRGGDVSLSGGERHTLPELRSDKNIVYGVEGRTVTIAFNLTGNPLPNYKWYFNDLEIDTAAQPLKYRAEYQDNIVSLRIAFISQKDVGYYGCGAWNAKGRASVGVKLALADPPMFLEPLRDLTLTLYGNGALECRIDGSPYPEVRFYKDWKLVPPSSRIKMKHWEPHLWTMNFSNSIHRDSGLYIVEAENVAGKIHCIANLKVEETPSQLLNIVFRPSNVEDYYHILEEIGRGSSAVIRRVIEKSTNHEFAAKFIRIFDENLRSSLKTEVETIRWLHHRHIMHIEDAFETRKFLVIVCELITGGLMFEKIIADDTLTERDVASWVKQLLVVLAHIHEHQIAYLDLQPENIHLCSPKHSAYANEVKLIDFGWAVKLNNNAEVVSAHCNPEFSAPEVARSEPVTTAADIWSLGVLTYLMLTGESPAWAGSYEESFKRLKNGDLKLDSPVLKELSQEACDFISACLHLEPSKRPSSQSLLEHPFVGFAERLGKGTRLSVSKLKEYTDRLLRSKEEGKLNLAFEVQKRRAASAAPSDAFVDARSRTPSPERPTTAASAMTQSGTAVDADFWDDWMDQYVCGAAEDVKEKLKYYYYRTGQHPKVTEGLGKIGVKEQMDDADWYQLALNLQNRLSRREAERRAADGMQPSFNVCMNDGGYEVGRNYVLMARVDGRPAPVITWYRNDEALHDGYRVATHASPEGHAWLTLLMAKPHDAASYKCVARNAFGIARCRNRISEGDAPGAPGRPVISAISATEAVVIWDAPKETGNIPSRYYKVDYRDDHSEKWTCAGYTIDESALVSGLQPNTIYRFRVSCGNRLNLGNYSYGSIEVKTKETGSPALELSDEKREAMLKSRQFSCPPIVEALQRGRHFFLENSVTAVANTADYFQIVDPTIKRPIETINGSNMVQMVSQDFSLGENLKRQTGVSFTLVTESKTSRKYLLKTASKTSSAGLKLMRELEILREIECNRIEVVRAAFETADELSTISLPLHHDLDIVQHLCYKNKYSENDVAVVVRQLLDALHYLHKRCIVHSNISPRCVLVDDILSITVRLCGFDRASQLAIGVSEVQRPAYNADDDADVDVQFLAPELFDSSKQATISYQTDVWSVAAVAFVLLSGESPFAGADVAAKIKEGDWRSDDLYENTTKPAFKFLVQTLKALPLHRLTTEEAQEHRWLALSEDAIASRNTVHFSTAKLRAYNNARK